MRVASRWRATGRPERIKMLQAMLICLRGTIVLYQGEELGLPHSDVPRHRLMDPEAVRFWPNHRGRDGARTPMPWTQQLPSLGFSEVDGWLPAESAHQALAISVQQNDTQSMLAHCREMLALRRRSRALKLGDWELISAAETSLIVRRRSDGEELVCGFNWGDDSIRVPTGRVLAGKVQGEDLAPDSYVIADCSIGQ
jgi:alpha-glucosidase